MCEENLSGLHKNSPFNKAALERTMEVHLWGDQAPAPMDCDEGYVHAEDLVFGIEGLRSDPLPLDSNEDDQGREDDDPFWGFDNLCWDREDCYDEEDDAYDHLLYGFKKQGIGDRMKSALKSKWLYVVVLGLLALFGSSVYTEQIKQLLLSILGN